jgi:transposase
MEAYAGIDLHSTNSYIGIIDEKDQRHFAKRLPNSISQILEALEPFKENVDPRSGPTPIRKATKD